MLVFREADEMFVPVKRQNVVMYKYGTYDYLHGVRSGSKEFGFSKKSFDSSVLENSYAFPSRVVDGMHIQETMMKRNVPIQPQPVFHGYKLI